MRDPNVNRHYSQEIWGVEEKKKKADTMFCGKQSTVYLILALMGEIVILLDISYQKRKGVPGKNTKATVIIALLLVTWK